MQIKTPLVTYVDYLLGNPVNESYEVSILRLDLEASTNITADTVDMLCTQLKNTDLGEDNNVSTAAIIHELTKRYNTEAVHCTRTPTWKQKQFRIPITNYVKTYFAYLFQNTY